jgi:hypothetical protein
MRARRVGSNLSPLSRATALSPQFLPPGPPHCVRGVFALLLMVGCGDAKSSAPAPSASQASDDVPSIDVPFIGDAAITIDGALTDKGWGEAANLGNFVGVSTGKPTASNHVQGFAKLFWDESYLYVAISVEDAKIRGGFPNDAVDPHLWERDTAEIMIDPKGDGDNKDYFEIQIGPQNLVFDSRFDDYNKPKGGPNGPFGHEEWSSEVKSAVAIYGTLDDDSNTDVAYVVEARFPWSAFERAVKVPPDDGDSWRMNFYAMENNGGVAWSPILGKGNFHKASRFGRVTFVR